MKLGSFDGGEDAECSRRLSNRQQVQLALIATVPGNQHDSVLLQIVAVGILVKLTTWHKAKSSACHTKSVRPIVSGVTVNACSQTFPTL